MLQEESGVTFLFGPLEMMIYHLERIYVDSKFWDTSIQNFNIFTTTAYIT